MDPYGKPAAPGSQEPPQGPPQPVLEPVHGGAPDPRWLAPQGAPQGPAMPPPTPGYAPGYQPSYPPAYPPAFPYAPPPAPAAPKGSRLVNGLLVVAGVIAIGGLAFAVGRMTAPAAAATTAGTDQGLGFGNGRFPTASGAPPAPGSEVPVAPVPRSPCRAPCQPSPQTPSP